MYIGAQPAAAPFRKAALVYIGAPPAAAPVAVSLLGAPARVSVYVFGVLWRRRPRASVSRRRPLARLRCAGARSLCRAGWVSVCLFGVRWCRRPSPVAARFGFGCWLLSARVPALPFCLALPSGCRNGCITKAAGLPCGRRLRLCLCGAFRKCVPQKK